MIGYTSRSSVENFLGRTFPEAYDTEFATYISAAEKTINNILGYTARTTTSGVLVESVVREKVVGKMDAFDSLVIDVMKPPINFDALGNPLVTLLEFNLGGIRIPLQLTDGTSNPLNTLLEVPATARKILYPSLYFFPAIATVTPTAKVNLSSLRDVRFYVDVSYTGGYPTVPEDIQLATNMLVGQMLTTRDNPTGVVGYKQGNYQVEFLPRSNRFAKGQPIDKTFAIVAALLQPYKRVTW